MVQPDVRRRRQPESNMSTTTSLINRNAPSTIVNGSVKRNKVQYEIKEVVVDMVIKDVEASSSMDDLNELYIEPAAKWLKEQVGERMLVGQLGIPLMDGLKTLNIRGIRMFSEYDTIRQGTYTVFRVLAATPVEL